MELDDYLEHLKAQPIPDLSGIDGAQLATHARLEQRQGRTMLAVAGAAAMMIGVAGGMPAGNAAAASVVPFGPPASLAPLMQLGRE